MARRKPSALLGGYSVVLRRLLGSLDGLTTNERMVYLALKLGATSSFAGIGFVYVEVLVADTALSPREIEAALARLEKFPTPTSPLIVRDGPVIWVRGQLEADPGVQKAVATLSEAVGTLSEAVGTRQKPVLNLTDAQRKGISRRVATLPQHNRAVVRFLRHYKQILERPTGGPSGGGAGGATGGGTGGPTGGGRGRLRSPVSGLQSPISGLRSPAEKTESPDDDSRHHEDEHPTEDDLSAEDYAKGVAFLRKHGIERPDLARGIDAAQGGEPPGLRMDINTQGGEPAGLRETKVAGNPTTFGDTHEVAS